ncbi:hypothetical protein [Cloacibacillus porcorum]|uniref:hypothetical protein n=1 Tax=Cloacibacillus porcorum TaxID=1197717 RepID=UPI0023F01D36|nr:hypothetical protein [Cloacibacillus porcorum]MDD7648441.1 hypothetical protein [Cloacibacillus porcorum]MDY4094490.1 hypothetical protein [Cloacibacillus porcorum]
MTAEGDISITRRSRCASAEKGVAGALLEASLKALEAEGINKAALVVFARNKTGNAFWENRGFSVREDLIYRNKTIREFTRIDT